jgi:N-acetylated-alpha-linked acidic dipeptidase
LRRLSARKHRGREPGGKPAPAFAGLPRLIESVKGFQAASVAADRATAALSGRDGVPVERLSKVNDALMKVERAFLLPNGLPGRPWFKHAIYAPGLTTGYACWPLPGIRQALMENDAEMLDAQTTAVVGRIDAATEALRLVVKLAEDEPKPARPAEAEEPKPATKPVAAPAAGVAPPRSGC